MKLQNKRFIAPLNACKAIHCMPFLWVRVSEKGNELGQGLNTVIIRGRIFSQVIAGAK